MKKGKILIVEDDKHLSKLVKYNLEKANYEVFATYRGEEALKILSKQNVDLIILDIMLPGIDGLEICRLLKQDAKLKTIPIVILTAKGEEVDRIVGLELGADDYVVKPFSPRELILRIKAILRRSKAEEEEKKEIIEKGKLFIDLAKYKVMVNKQEVELTPLEFKLLVLLVQRAGRIQSRDKLLADVWGMEADIYTRTVDTHIKRLRKKLGRVGAFIETVKGLGYRFKEENDED